jgi:hypothetical protein
MAAVRIEGDGISARTSHIAATDVRRPYLYVGCRLAWIVVGQVESTRSIYPPSGLPGSDGIV